MTYALDDPEEAQIAQQLKDTEGRLVDHYAGSQNLTEDRVRHTVGLVAQAG